MPAVSLEKIDSEINLGGVLSCYLACLYYTVYGVLYLYNNIAVRPWYNVRYEQKLRVSVTFLVEFGTVVIPI